MTRTRRFIAAVLGSALLVTGLIGPALAGETDTPGVYEPGSTPLGASYGIWAERFGAFAFQTPVGENPFVHPNECEDSVKVVKGAVLLTASGGGHLIVSCPIPENTPILVTPGGNQGVLGVNGDTPDAVRHYVNASLAKYSGVRMKVDGEAVSDIDDFRTHTPGLFTLDMPGRNILGLPAGPAQLFIGGWFVMLKGFDEGTHTVYTHDILDDGTVASVTFHLTAI